MNKKGKVNDAEEIFQGITPDVFSFCTLIDGFSKLGNMHKASSIFDEMDKQGHKASSILLLSVEMSGKDFHPKAVTYCTIIDGCCKHGDLEEAFRLLDEMKLKDSFVYTTLVDGCCRLNNVERL
ncbi:Pentatricopeptide repeat [Arabidopsis suecica]|uniref:Pentatricopeptide repeat n=1 Tax=Arabidopsis suecica TaxID=45249 RepID=A0A8T2CQM0_ARASU|nr:Pentatricopeptide repeat [Arabidopsis suecica]